MSIFEIPYGEKVLTVDIDEKKILFFASPVKTERIPDPQLAIEESLESPIQSKKLEELVNSAMQVIIMVDDTTRPTPKKLILTSVLKRLEKAGIKKNQIKIAIGLGTHRQMTHYEIEEHIGLENISGSELINIDYKDIDRFVDLGYSENGTPIEVYREVVESDFRIAIGNIVPHITAGWGGGAKMIQPGVCSEKTTEVTHLMSCMLQDVMDVCGTTDNVARNEMVKIAGLVGLDFIVNTVMDEEKNILGVFSGHFEAAHLQGVELAKKVMCPEIPEKADILIASANPSYIDYWQGCKPYIFAQYGVKNEGVLIFVINASEGLCGNAPHHKKTLVKYSKSSVDEIRNLVEEGKIDDIVGITVPLLHASVRNRVTTICVSEGFTKEDIECLGFVYAKNLEDALLQAYELKSKDAKIGIIPFCGETLVREKQKIY